MRVLVACEYSGVVRDAFITRGHEAMSCAFKEVPGFPGYTVCTDGSVWSNRHARGPREKYHRLSGRGGKYLSVTLCREDGLHCGARIHRLVAELFIPNPNNLPCVRHLNGNSLDNRASNLAWGTYKENEADKKAHGTWDTRRNGKLTKEMREEAVRLRLSGASQKKIAEKFSVSRPTITRLLNGATWSGVAE